MDRKVKTPGKGKSGFQKFKNRLSFLIILAFAGFVFYMGWIQIRIPEGKYALVYTKTGGYDRTLIEPGQFVWRWENLFPGNLSLHFIDLVSMPGSLDISGYLPSGELYGTFIHEPDAFRFSVKAEYRFSSSEDQFVSLIESGAYSPDTMESNSNQYISEVNTLVRQYVIDHSPLSPGGMAEVEKDLISLVSDTYPGFILESFRITGYSYPDQDLYEAAKSLYISGISALREVEMKEEQSTTRAGTITARKMDLLRSYGEILSEFPVLLQYFGLDREKLDPALFAETGLSSESP